jgi:uncharacterized protein (DUF608 family)
VAFGGIGCGKIEVLPCGWFGNVSLNTNWDSPIRTSRSSFFAISVESRSGRRTKILRLARDWEYDNVENVAHASYLGLFPTAVVGYEDPELPVAVQAEIASSLVPQNIEDSAIPAVQFRMTVTNTSQEPALATLVFSFENLLGRGGYMLRRKKEVLSVGLDGTDGNRIEPFRRGGLSGVTYATKRGPRDPRMNATGTYAIACAEQDGVTIWPYGYNDVGGHALLLFGNQGIDPSHVLSGKSPCGMNGKTNYAGAIAASFELAPKASRTLDFVLAWHTPHHHTRADKKDNGRFFARRWKTARDVALYATKHRDRLRAATAEWQTAILDSSLPGWLKFRLINGAFPLYANSILTKKGQFGVIESPITMKGAVGTMDQRMASHGIYTQLFTELDRRELDSFSRCQQKDGRITHFTGNLHEILENPKVGYGITDWPDLSCSWGMQIYKHCLWTGDLAFLRKTWPRIKKNLAWLERADKDHDFVPEGGSTYDYEKAPGGMFSYTASCYLGYLVCAIEMARTMKDTKTEASLEARLEKVRASVVDHLWNGRYFRKWKDLAAKTSNENSFIASLAGDWLARLAGAGGTLDYAYVRSNVESLLDRHVVQMPLVPPMEVDLEGRVAVDASYVLQHEPYLGCEAIYAGFPDLGIEVLRRNYSMGWRVHHVGWMFPLSHNARTNEPLMLNTYMTAPSTWHVLNALGGATLDLPSKALYLHPVTIGGTGKLEIPLFFPRFWLWLSYDKKKQAGSVRVMKTFGKKVTIERLRAVTREGTVVEEKLKRPFVVAEGKTLAFEPLVLPR